MDSDWSGFIAVPERRDAAQPAPAAAPTDTTQQPSTDWSGFTPVPDRNPAATPPPGSSIPPEKVPSSFLGRVGNYAAGMATPDYWKGVASGAATLPMGAMQTIAHGIESIVPPSPGVRPASQQIESGLSTLNQPGSPTYESGRTVGPYAGAAAATLAAPYLLPEALTGLGGMGAMGAGIRGALGGGALGASTPINNPDQNYWTQKAEQTGASALTGGVLSWLMRGLAPSMSATDIPVSKAEKVLTQNSDYWTPARLSAASDLNKQQAAAKVMGINDQPPGLLARLLNTKGGQFLKDWGVGLPMGETIFHALGSPAEALKALPGYLPLAATAGAGYAGVKALQSPLGQALAPYISGMASEGAARNQGQIPFTYGGLPF